MSISVHMAFVATVVLLAVCFPGATSAEHCASVNYVDALEPSVTETWKIGTTHDISWIKAEGCGLVTYQVELSRDNQPFEIIEVTDPVYFVGRFAVPWRVTGAANSQVQFRVRRVLPDRVTEYAYTAPIHIGITVGTLTSSWGMLRSRF
jgi:hypothetical protein